MRSKDPSHPAKGMHSTCQAGNGSDGPSSISFKETVTLMDMGRPLALGGEATSGMFQASSLLGRTAL